MNTAIASKYHRTTPVRQFDLNQTLYTTVFKQNKNNMDVDAIGFLGKNITFKELKNNVDRLADAYAKIGVKEGDTVGICTINMPIVQENLLALSKLGATSKWIDLRIKGRDRLCTKLNRTTMIRQSKRNRIIKKLFGYVGGKPYYVASPLYVQYGVNVSIGKSFISNYNLVLLDGGKIDIGDNVMIAPNVTVCPGVTIGKNSVIGAGSVVTRDIPANVLAYGVPCKVIREITDEDRII